MQVPFKTDMPAFAGGNRGMIKEYDYRSIRQIDKKGILFDDGFFIDFEASRTNWAKSKEVLADKTYCVADRDITASRPYFEFYSDNRVIIFFKKGFFSNWHKHFQKIRFTIEEMGFTTYDLS